jgi:hypothetical protein
MDTQISVSTSAALTHPAPEIHAYPAPPVHRLMQRAKRLQQHNGPGRQNQ